MGNQSSATSPKLITLDEVGSTNDELMARARAGATHGTAIRAREQTAGKGRRAHNWSSPAGGLYLSVLIIPQVPAHLLAGLPVACGIGVARALRGAGCSGVQLKWPNDIVANGRKLGGILVEAENTAAGMRAVCGIGINYRSPEHIAADVRTASALVPAGLVDTLPQGAVPPTLDELAVEVRAHVLDTVAAWERAIAAASARGADAAPLTGIVDTYNDLLAFAGQHVEVIPVDGGPHEAGVFLRVDEHGRAVVALDSGEQRRYDTSHTSLRPKNA